VVVNNCLTPSSRDNPPREDAGRLGLDSRLAVVESRRGSLTARVRVVATVRAGQEFLPMHDPRVNQLTAPVFDPYSRQPGYKQCAVRVGLVDSTTE